jgi:four helix bundle protein
MESYRGLDVWQKSYLLAREVYRHTEAFPRREVFGLISQLRRAAVSVPTNIAEGYCRRGRGEYLHFVGVAQGSAGELDTLLSLARDVGYLEPGPAEELERLLNDVGMMLTRLAQSLSRADQSSMGRTGGARPAVPRPE